MDAFNKVKQYLQFINDDVRQLPEYVSVNMDKYGLGTKRSLESYWKFTGIDTKKQTVSTNFCEPGNVATADDIEKSSELRWKEGFENQSLSYSEFNEFNSIYPYIQLIGGYNWSQWIILFLFVVTVIFIYTVIFCNVCKKRFR
jgi:hypothetical protein